MNHEEPPELSIHSPEGRLSVNESDLEHKRIELELARLRIKELEMRIELERVCQKQEFRSSPKTDHTGSGLLATTIELPKREIQRFDGNPKNYWSFIKAFQNTVENRIDDDEARLSYLIQFCDGDARSQIMHCTVLEPTEGFRSAKEILHKRFGQNHMVARAFVDELLNGQQIRDGDSQSLVALAQKLTVCDVTLKQLNYSSDLNSRTTIQSIVRRLPSRLRFKWAKAAMNIRQSNREPEVADLAAFVEHHVDSLCSDYGELAVTMAAEERANRGKSRAPVSVKTKSFVNTSQVSTEPQETKTSFTICGSEHYADKCEKFLSMSLEQRSNTVRERKLCIICLRRNHLAKECRSQRRCLVNSCGGNHHTLLHPRSSCDPQTPVAASHHISHTSNSSAPTHANSKEVALAVLPVKVISDTDKLDTCVFLDSGSDSSFITRSLADSLNLVGHSKNITI